MRKLLTAILLCLALGLVVACQSAPTSQPGAQATSTVLVQEEATATAPAEPQQEATATTSEPQAEATTTTASEPQGEATATTSEASLVPEELSDLVIHMERTICFGTCPVYSVTIYGDGTVEYLGERFVAVEGEQTAQISEEQVRELVQAFYDADFFNMQDRYEDNVTDLPSTTTTITLNGETKSVYNYFGAPEELEALEDKIDEISGAAEWVGPR
jgi:hypothetical protein